MMWVTEEAEDNKGSAKGRNQLVVLDMSSECSMENPTINERYVASILYPF